MITIGPSLQNSCVESLAIMRKESDLITEGETDNDMLCPNQKMR